MGSQSRLAAKRRRVIDSVEKVAEGAMFETYLIDYEQALVDYVSREMVGAVEQHDVELRFLQEPAP